MYDKVHKLEDYSLLLTESDRVDSACLHLFAFLCKVMELLLYFLKNEREGLKQQQTFLQWVLSTLIR